MKTSIIPVFIPHLGCPYRCIFCNQQKITGHKDVPTGQEVARRIEKYTRGKARHWEVAFYGGSFTAVAAVLQEELLQPAYEALKAGKIAAVRCSTRPDCITPDKLARLKKYGVTVVELGVQSMDDAVLRKAKRGHTATDVERAVMLLREQNFAVGLQLMPGLPEEDRASLMATTERICALKPDFTRIYPVVVIDNTELADLYKEGSYKPLTVDEGVRRAAFMKEHFLRNGIACIRTGLQATEELDRAVNILGGAYAPAMGEMVDSLRYGRQIRHLLEELNPDGTVTVAYNRKDTSRTRGYKNENMRIGPALRIGIKWMEDNSLATGVLRIETGWGTWRLHTDKGTRLRVL